jgi:hypothetical protein
MRSLNAFDIAIFVRFVNRNRTGTKEPVSISEHVLPVNIQRTLRLVLSFGVALTGLCGCSVGSSPAPPTLPAASAPPIVPTPSPTSAIAPTPTWTPTPQATLIPTVTSAPTPAGVLTEEESRRLYESSLEYIALTSTEAITVARSLRFLVSEGHPSNMCGPLALAILRDAGLVDESVILHDFWLLDPSEPSDIRLLEETFPPHRYLWHNVLESVATFDFDAFPLQAGDLLYLLAGPGGTFEHIVVVTRVDETGRAFSVTNVNTAEGFIINEVMLYDPHQPGAGKFYEWTDPSNIHLGLTGRGGFLLWRRVEPLREEDSEASTQLGIEIGELLSDQGGHWNVAIQKVGGDLVYHRGAEEILSAPWAIEITTALLFFHVLDQQGVDDYAVYIENNGVHGQTFRHLIEAMLVDGDPTATRSLTSWVDGQLDAKSVLRDWGIHQTTHVPSQSTALDIATVVEGLHGKRLGTEEARTFILDRLRGKESEQAIGDVILHTYEGAAQAISTESSDTGVVRQVIVAETKGEAYAIVIHGSPPRYGEKEASLEELVRTAEEITLAFIDEYLTPTVDP